MRPFLVAPVATSDGFDGLDGDASFPADGNQLPEISGIAFILHQRVVARHQNAVKAKVAQMEAELSAKMTQFGVEKKEVEQVAILKAELTKKGLKLQTILKLAKEF